MDKNYKSIKKKKKFKTMAQRKKLIEENPQKTLNLNIW